MAMECPACSRPGMEVFFEQQRVPVHSCLLVTTRIEALRFPKGDVVLAVCAGCGFISNVAFDPAVLRYSADYEETQSHSPRFRAFASTLAEDWVRQHHLRGKEVLEVGCGKGEFLLEMLRAGAGRGIGIDPGVIPERLPAGEQNGRVEWITDFFDERHLDLRPDAVVCRHTLEHIQPVGAFVEMIAGVVAGRSGVPVLFELPDVLRVLREGAFWDVYYEHCSYFSPGALARLFRRQGLAPESLRLAFDDQYILLDARVSGRKTALENEESPAEVVHAATRFADCVGSSIATWRKTVVARTDAGCRVVVWGGGSKGVAFLNALGADVPIEAVVDINPVKAGKFIAGSGHQVVLPSALTEIQPDVVVLMNPIYREEIGSLLARAGVEAEVLAL